MATSGSTNFSVAGNTLVQNAFQIAGVYGVGRSLSVEDQTLAYSLLNMLIKTWGTKGLHLWSKERAYVFPVKDQAEYLIGSTAKACLKSEAVITTVGSTLASGVTSIAVTSSSGMATSDVVGIVLDGGAVHYSTIASITDATHIVINDATTAATAAGNSVYTYTTSLGKPLRIHSSRRLTGVGATNSSIPMEGLSMSEYDDVPNKNISGAPTTYSFKPTISYGEFKVWPAPSSGNTYFEITMERTLEDIDTSANDFDFPQEWYEPLTYQLALRLCIPFGRMERYNQLLPVARDLLDQLLSWDSEITEVSIVPDDRGR